MGWLSFWFAGFMYIIVRESFWKIMISSFQTDSLCTKYAVPYSYVWTKWHMLYHGDIPGYFVWHAICFCISVILWCHCVWETLVENKLFLDCWQLHLNFRYAETDYFLHKTVIMYQNLTMFLVFISCWDGLSWMGPTTRWGRALGVKFSCVPSSWWWPFYCNQIWNLDTLKR